MGAAEARDASCAKSATVMVVRRMAMLLEGHGKEQCRYRAKEVRDWRRLA